MAVQILSFIQPTFPFPLSPSPSHQFSPLPSPNPESATRNPQRNTQNHQSLKRLIIIKTPARTRKPGSLFRSLLGRGGGRVRVGGKRFKKREGEEGNEGNGGKRKGGKAIGVAKRLGGGRKWRLNCNSVILPPPPHSNPNPFLHPPPSLNPQPTAHNPPTLQPAIPNPTHHRHHHHHHRNTHSHNSFKQRKIYEPREKTRKVD